MFWCEEGLEMCDFTVDGLVMIGFVLVTVLMSADVDDGLGMIGFKLTVPGLGVRMRDGLRMCEICLICWVLECCCSGCDVLHLLVYHVGCEFV